MEGGAHGVYHAMDKSMSNVLDLSLPSTTWTANNKTTHQVSYNLCDYLSQAHWGHQVNPTTRKASLSHTLPYTVQNYHKSTPRAKAEVKVQGLN